jgi:hypothetical protein
MEAERFERTIRESEKLVEAMANRYGFRASDYALIWDSGEFEVSRSLHQLIIVAADGRRSTAHIEHEALMQQDAWKYFGEVDRALMHLARRTETRGV